MTSEESSSSIDIYDDFIKTKQFYRSFKNENNLVQNPSYSTPKMTKEDWLRYGKENKYDGLNRKKLKEKEPQYHFIGLKNGWIDDLIPKKNGIKQVLDDMLTQYNQGAGK